MFRRKPVEAFVTETPPDEEGGELSRSIGLFQLTMFGVGATIGTGIFIILTEAVPEAGPGVIVSFVLAGITAALTAMCYAELASTIPVSGSSYSYTYATMGEIVAFGVAACLLLEYGVSSAAVSVGWAQYLDELFSSLFGFRMPEAILAAPGEGGFFNLPAIVLVTLCGLLLMRGARESATVNAVMVIIKIAVLIFFVIIAFTAFSGEHFVPFAPFGIAGIGAAASSIFFTFIGLDAVSTAGEEVHNPRRTLPLAIIFATIIVTTVYILVAVAAVGALPADQLAGQDAPLSVALSEGAGIGWGGSCFPKDVRSLERTAAAAGYFERNLRMIEVLVDRDAVTGGAPSKSSAAIVSQWLVARSAAMTASSGSLPPSIISSARPTAVTRSTSRSSQRSRSASGFRSPPTCTRSRSASSTAPRRASSSGFIRYASKPPGFVGGPYPDNATI